jgi:hypothetical protein
LLSSSIIVSVPKRIRAMPKLVQAIAFFALPSLFSKMCTRFASGLLCLSAAVMKIAIIKNTKAAALKGFKLPADMCSYIGA